MFINIFRASICPLSGQQVVHCRIWPSALVLLAVVLWSQDAICVRPSSTQPQPSQTVQNTIRVNAHSCSPDVGHSVAQNILKQEFVDKHQISCILLISLPSPTFLMYGHKNLKYILLILTPFVVSQKLQKHVCNWLKCIQILIHLYLLCSINFMVLKEHKFFSVSLNKCCFFYTINNLF